MLQNKPFLILMLLKTRSELWEFFPFKGKSYLLSVPTTPNLAVQHFTHPGYIVYCDPKLLQVNLREYLSMTLETIFHYRLLINNSIA